MGLDGNVNVIYSQKILLGHFYLLSNPTLVIWERFERALKGMFGTIIAE